MSSNTYKKTPVYYGFRIYFLSTVLYFFLVFPIAGILITQYLPDFMEQNDTTQADSTAITAIPVLPPNIETESIGTAFTDTMELLINDTMINALALQSDTLIIPTEATDAAVQEPESANQIGSTLSLLIRLLVISFILGLIFNLPFKRFFRKKRRLKPVSNRLNNFCRKYLLKTPIINSAILSIAYGINIGYMVYILLFQTVGDEINQQLYLRYFIITIVASILTILFVYFWQKHRVHIRYLDLFFSQEELKRRIFNLKTGRIRNRLLTSAIMTTLLPLVIVTFYLLISITTVHELNIEELSAEQLNILLGKYANIDIGLSIENMDSLFYVNVINSFLMFVGITSGILIAFFYLLFFVKWTTEDIVYPVKELLANMQKTGRGELDNYSIVRTNDEIGVLTEGYNEMSFRIKRYIGNISDINEANSRFVPKQFLDFLGKESIADIQLGDQIQKEMTILFSDIRDFTTLSEQMTPKENFDFLNNYLGYMEPVISNNNGFVDKFIGDSIMALFPEKSEDAINAAIEMRLKLTEFNQIMSQFGKPPISSGLGIHTGDLMLGVVGGEGRMDGTVISDAVNLTSRVEGLTKVYGCSVIITEDTLIKVTDPSHYNYRFLDIVKVKGKKEAVYIFEIIDGELDALKSFKLETKEMYGSAVQAYKKHDFNDALNQFSNLNQINENDKVLNIYMNRCKRYMKEGVPHGWDGAEHIDYKF